MKTEFLLGLGIAVLMLVSGCLESLDTNDNKVCDYSKMYEELHELDKEFGYKRVNGSTSIDMAPKWYVIDEDAFTTNKSCFKNEIWDGNCLEQYILWKEQQEIEFRKGQLYNLKVKEIWERHRDACLSNMKPKDE